MLISVLAALLQIQFPSEARGKAVKGGPGAGRCPLDDQMDFVAAGFGPAGLLQ